MLKFRYHNASCYSGDEYRANKCLYLRRMEFLLSTAITVAVLIIRRHLLHQPDDLPLDFLRVARNVDLVL